MASSGFDVKSMHTTRSDPFVGLQKESSVMCKKNILKGSGLFMGCLFTYWSYGVKAVPHVVLFSSILHAGVSAMAPAVEKLYDDTCKHAECEKPSTRFGVLSCLHALLKNPFQAYSCFLVGLFIIYCLCGGKPLSIRSRYIISYVSCCLEGFGLTSLLYKISHRGHVQGLSGMSMIMFTLTYSIREYETFFLAKVNWKEKDNDLLEVLQMSSMFMSWMVLFAIFKTYRASYQADMDVMKVQYLIPGCIFLAIVLHPNFKRGQWYSVTWSASFYIDTLALLPQVVMMQRGNGKVEAPIANFVAATAVSRSFDLSFWFNRLVNEGLGRFFSFHVALSGVIVFFFHLFNLALVGDFMYYFYKSRLSGAAMSQDIDITEALADAI
jgi:hypothetical protein